MTDTAEIATYVALLGVLIAVFQLIVSNKQAVASRRPVMVLSLDLTKTVKDERLYLTIQNVGSSPAKAVFVEFEAGKNWHWVSNPSYPFLREFGGLPVVAPGKSIRYFLGIVKVGGKLDYLKTSGIRATVTSAKPVGFFRFRDKYTLTLSHRKFESKPESA
jgi:hypothetical protein